MYTVPAATPVTTPIPDPEGTTVATALLLLDHVPLDVAFERFVVSPLQIVEVPIIKAGKGLIVNKWVLKHPVGAV
jgi:hypothetical protein